MPCSWSKVHDAAKARLIMRRRKALFDVGGRALRSFACLIILICLVSPNAAEGRTRNVALIIANSEYDNVRWPVLGNTLADARLIAGTMKKAGFEVVQPAINLNYDDLSRRLAAFKQLVAGLPPDSIVWIYFAGHGVQINGENYLIPIGAPTPDEVTLAANDETEHDLAAKFIPLATLVDVLGARTNPTQDTANVIVLDACRTNPFLRRGPRTARGLADIPHTANTLIAFSATAGQTADDGPLGGNSPYAASFSESISSAYLPLELLFNRITQKVAERTTRLQRPEYRVGLAGFYCISECSFRDPSERRSEVPKTPNRGDCIACFSGQIIRLRSGKGLWVAATVTSESAWQACVAQLACVSPKQTNEPDRPVTSVSWEEIQAYLTWLYNLSGKQYRLPTSGEWDDIASQVGRLETSNPSRELPPIPTHSERILFDTGVSEWTSSCGDLAQGNCEGRIVRGRSWRDGDVDPKSTQVFNQTSRGDAIGFRVVADQPAIVH